MKLAEALRILHSPPPPESAPFSLHLVTGSEALHLKTFLAAELQTLLPGRRIEVATGSYGDLEGSLDRALKSPGEGIAVVAEWADLDPRLGLRAAGGWQPRVLPDIAREVESRIDRILARVRAKPLVAPLAIALPTLPLPPLDWVSGCQTGTFGSGLRLATARWAAELAAIPLVRLVNPQRLDELSPMADRPDVRAEMLAGFPYRLPHASALAGLLARLLCPPPPKKGLVTDLDDTLWRGILGEDGVDGVAWDLEHAAPMHGLYQQLLAALAEAGVLVGVATRNDPDLVASALRREGLRIPADRLFPVQAGWGPKSESLRRILEAWNIGPESVVFVDDNPLEIDEVRAAFPQIEGLQFPTRDEAGILALLNRLRDLFGKPTLLEEDRLRLDSLKRRQERDSRAPAESASAESVLRDCGAELLVDFTPDPADARALELVNKTRQFNLNGRRRHPSEWAGALSGADAVMLTVAYEDKYGPLGKIAVALGRTTGATLEVDTWVMSCRAFGRRIEHQCLSLLFRRTGVEEIRFHFSPTEGNRPLQEFFEALLGFRPEGVFSLSRAGFEAACPPLYHRIRERDHG